MSSHEEHISLGTYSVIFIALLILLGVTIWAATVDMGAFSFPVAMLIATSKAVLICAYFMHLKLSSRWMLTFFLTSVYVLAVGGILLFNDYFTRAIY